MIHDNKRVGIATFYCNNNYGSSLQLFALYSQLKKMGYSPYALDFLHPSRLGGKFIRIMIIGNRILGMFRVPKLLLYRKKSQNKEMRPETFRKFQDFYEENVKYDDSMFSKKGAYYAYIAGSDQVWNINIPNLHYVFFLRFAKKRKRISYAASFGGNSVPAYNRKRLKKYLEGMRYISVREESGVDIVKDLTGRSVPCVLDPVLLTGKEFWYHCISSMHTYPKEYILCYFLDDTKLGYKAIRKLNLGERYIIKWIDAGVPCRCKEYELEMAAPLEFVSLIKNSRYVITDSFHAAAFSLLFSKEFFVIDRNYLIFNKQSDRIYSLLKSMNIEGRYIKNDCDIEGIESVRMYDAENIEKILNKRRTESEDYLIKALKGVGDI